MYDVVNIEGMDMPYTGYLAEQRKKATLRAEPDTVTASGSHELIV